MATCEKCGATYGFVDTGATDKLCPRCAGYDVTGMATGTPGPTPTEYARADSPQLDTTATLLSETRPWVKFLSIVGFVSVGLMAFGGCVAFVVGVASGEPVALLGLLYGLLGVLYYFPALFLHRYAKGIRDFVGQRRQDQLDTALDAQKSFWRFTGILTLVVLCIYGVALLGLIVAAVASMM